MAFRTTCAILPRVLRLLRPRPTLTCRHLRLEGCNGCSVLAHTQPQASSWLEGSCSCIHLFHGARPSRSLGCGLAVDVDHSFHPRIVSTRSTTSTTTGPHSLMGPGVFGVLAQSVLARRSVWTLHACPPPMHRTHALHACTARIHYTHALHACTARMQYTHALHACTTRMPYTHALHAGTAHMHCAHPLHPCTACMHCTHACAFPLPDLSNASHFSAPHCSYDRDLL